MKYIGPIPIPALGVARIDDYEDIIDFLLDLRLDNLDEAVTMLLKDGKPKILITTNKDKEIFGLIAYKAPDNWKTFKEQELFLWAAPSIEKLLTYFNYWYIEASNEEERLALSSIRHYLEKLKKYQNTIITYSNPHKK